MPVVSGSSVIRGSRGTPVAQDTNDKLITVVQGDQDIPVTQTATGELVTEMHGSEGIAVKQETTGELISVIQGSEGVDVKQKASGELITEIVGSTGNAVAQDPNDKLISVMQGSQGVAVAQDATNRLIAAMVGSTGNPISQDIADNLIAVMYGSLGNPITQDANDRLVSVMYGSQNTPILQDAANKLIAVMQGSLGTAVTQDAANRLVTAIVGSTGNPVSQDAGDNLIAMMYGSQGTPVAQDAADNLISVMKGNYEGALKTWKVDVDGRGEMFLTDPDDIWGNKRIMGLAEHSVRTHAPPLMFDRRGSIIYWDDFESTTRKYANANGTVARVTTRSKTRDASLECITGAGVGNRAEALYMISDFHAASRMGSQVSFACGGDVFAVGVSLSYYDMTDVHTWSIRLESDGTLQYGNLAGAWVDVAGSDSIYKQNDYNFATIKMVANLSDDTYERAVIFNREYDLSAFTCYSAASAATMPYLYASITIYTLEAVAKTAYFDNFYLTDNEPDN